MIPQKPAPDLIGGGNRLSQKKHARRNVERAGSRKPGSVSAGSLNVRFAPQATELLHRREMTRWARRRHRCTAEKAGYFVVPEQLPFSTPCCERTPAVALRRCRP